MAGIMVKKDSFVGVKVKVDKKDLSSKKKSKKLPKQCYFCQSEKDLRYMGAKIWICRDKKLCAKKCREFVEDEIKRFD